MDSDDRSSSCTYASGFAPSTTMSPPDRSRTKGSTRTSESSESVLSPSSTDYAGRSSLHSNGDYYGTEKVSTEPVSGVLAAFTEEERKRILRAIFSEEVGQDFTSESIETVSVSVGDFLSIMESDYTGEYQQVSVDYESLPSNCNYNQLHIRCDSNHDSAVPYVWYINPNPANETIPIANLDSINSKKKRSRRNCLLLVALILFIILLGAALLIYFLTRTSTTSTPAVTEKTLFFNSTFLANITTPFFNGQTLRYDAFPRVMTVERNSCRIIPVKQNRTNCTVVFNSWQGNGSDPGEFEFLAPKQFFDVPYNDNCSREDRNLFMSLRWIVCWLPSKNAHSPMACSCRQNYMPDPNRITGAIKFYHSANSDGDMLGAIIDPYSAAAQWLKAGVFELDHRFIMYFWLPKLDVNDSSLIIGQLLLASTSETIIINLTSSLMTKNYGNYSVSNPVLKDNGSSVEILIGFDDGLSHANGTVYLCTYVSNSNESVYLEKECVLLEILYQALYELTTYAGETIELRGVSFFRGKYSDHESGEESIWIVSQQRLSQVLEYYLLFMFDVNGNYLGQAQLDYNHFGNHVGINAGEAATNFDSIFITFSAQQRIGQFMINICVTRASTECTKIMFELK